MAIRQPTFQPQPVQNADDTQRRQGGVYLDGRHLSRIRILDK
jgi:hypothetical protein